MPDTVSRETLWPDLEDILPAGVTEASVVARAHDISPAQFYAIVTELRAGGTKVRLHWEIGSERIEASWEDDGVRIILTGPKLLEEPPKADPEQRLREAASAT